MSWSRMRHAQRPAFALLTQCSLMDLWLCPGICRHSDLPAVHTLSDGGSGMLGARMHGKLGGFGVEHMSILLSMEETDAAGMHAAHTVIFVAVPFIDLCEP